MLHSNCQHCGEQFEHNPSETGKYCSKKCYNQYRKEKGTVTEPCTVCETDVERYKCHADKYRTFCSEECENKWRKQTFSGEDNPVYSKKQVECEQCGQQFKRTPSRLERSNRTFCGRECTNKWYSDMLSSPWNPKWRTGDVQRDYGENWLEVRREVLKRDRFECQRCGMTWKEHTEKYNKSLDVHHKTPLREFESPKKANTMDNLVTLCKSCHMEVEHKGDTE